MRTIRDGNSSGSLSNIRSSRRPPRICGRVKPCRKSFSRGSLPCPSSSPAGNLLIEEVGIFDLINAFQKILKRLESSKHREDLREIFEENFTVSDKIDFLLRVIHGGVPCSLRGMFCGRGGRAEIVVTFLAMLELIRLKQLRVRQENHFAEIWIERFVLAATASTERLT